MQTYQTKRKSAPARTARPQAKPVTADEMLHLSGAGAPQPMSPALREKFEPGFSADFSNIRISRGHIPEEMGVQAVARGTDILLDSSAGMDVLGHELAHVVQQAQGRVEGGYPVVENAALEHEADVMGARVASGLTAQAGPQNSFGGELTTIAPMSGASAPAQCKSRGEKVAEKRMNATVNPEKAQRSQAAAANSAQMTDERAAMAAYGAELRADVNEKSQGVTEATTNFELLSGNRLNYMRNNEKSSTRQKKKEILYDAMDYTSDRYVQYLSQTSGLDGIYEETDQMGQNLSSPGQVKTVIRDIENNRAVDPDRKNRALAIRAKEDAKATKDLGIWMKMLEEDPHALEQFKMQVNEVYAPMGDFDAQTNKGGIVGGAQHAGLYALNDMFLRGGNDKLRDPHASKRNGLGMGLMNRVFAKVGDLDTMTPEERKLYDMMMAFSNQHGEAATTPAKQVAAPGPSLAPKPGQQYTTQADLPQSGPGWSHTGSWKHSNAGYYNMDDRTDLMPGGSEGSAFHRYFSQEEPSAPKKKKGLFSRLFGR